MTKPENKLEQKTIIKRSGASVPYQSAKIRKAIERASAAQEDMSKRLPDDAIETIVNNITSEVYSSDKVFTVEDIQDRVEKLLSDCGYFEVAKSYILYRKQHENVRKAKDTLLDYQKVVNDYLKVNDWRVKENSTVSYALGGLILNNSGAITANYWLSEIYDKEIADAHRDVRMHIHDLSMLSGYCAGWNLKQLIEVGITGVGGRISSKPASHLSTLCNQMVNFLGIMQNEWAGAQAFSSFDTYLAPYVKADNLSYKQVKQAIQSLVFGLNTPSRWGCSKITTKVLTPSSWKGADELKVGDTIFTWVNGVMKEAKLRHIIRHKNDYGVLHQYRGRNYVQTVTPDHRCIVEIGTARGTYAIKQSMDIFEGRKDLRMPASIEDVYLGDIDDSLSDDEVMLAAMYYADGTGNMDNGIEIVKSPLRDDGSIERVLKKLGLTFTLHNYGKDGKQNLNRYCISQSERSYLESIVGNKYHIAERFMHLSPEQSKLFIETWAKFDGCVNGRLSCQYDTDEIGDSLEIIMIRAGYLPHRWSRKKETDKNPTKYIYADNRKSVVIAERVEIPYDGEVWCPNTEDGTAIYKDEDGNIFISGNCQAPFTNVTIDWTVPDDLKDLPAIVGGKEMDFTYGDCKKEMDMINKAFIEIMIEGDANGRGFQYPIPTYSITPDFDWSETENNKLLFEMTAKYGIPYFSNYVNSDMKPSDIRSMCCRLRLDLRELRKKTGGFFGAGESTGSVGVVTLNLPRLAYESKSEEEFFKKLDELMDIAARSLKIKRTVISKCLDDGLYPYTKAYLGNFNNHFSTIGIVGMNEAGLNACWIKKDMTSPETQHFAIRVLNHMRERLSDYQEQYGDLYNLEATPAESTSYRFAKHDREKYPDIITANMNGTPYYTNSSHLPVGYTEDIFSALDIQDELQTLYTSGTVFHGFLGEKLPDWKAAMALVRKIAENYRLPYYTLSPTYSICTEHGYLTGEQEVCPYCGKKTEIYSRITGYYRAVQNWNDGKAQEFKDRRTYNIGHSRLAHSGPMNALPSDRPGYVAGKEIAHEKYELKPEKEPVMSERETEPAKDACTADACPIDFSKVKEDKKDYGFVLVTTNDCPKCKMLKQFLNSKEIPYEEMRAEDNMDKMLEMGIAQAPTLICGDDIVTGLGPIRAYVVKKTET